MRMRLKTIFVLLAAWVAVNGLMAGMHVAQMGDQMALWLICACVSALIVYICKELRIRPWDKA